MTKKRNPAASERAGQGLSAGERAALRETIKERRAAGNREEEARAAASAIAALPQPDRGLAQRIDAIVKKSAPDLAAKTWYGMPAYANKDGKVVCFFKPASKFKSRYATFGFEEAAQLDAGGMWVTSYAVTELSGADEAKLAALVKKAAS